MDSDFANWRLTSVTTAKGKSAIISDSNCEPIKIDTQTFLRCPYNAGSFDPHELVRWNLDLACSDELRDFLYRLDDWVIEELAKDQSYFKKKVSKEDIRLCLKPSCTQHEKDGIVYSPTIRCKINMAGPREVKCWSMDKNKITPPEDWRRCTCRAIIIPKNVWFMAQNDIGVCFEIHNCVLNEMDDTCPF